MAVIIGHRFTFNSRDALYVHLMNLHQMFASEFAKKPKAATGSRITRKVCELFDFLKNE